MIRNASGVLRFATLLPGSIVSLLTSVTAITPSLEVLLSAIPTLLTFFPLEETQVCPLGMRWGRGVDERESPDQAYLLV